MSRLTRADAVEVELVWLLEVEWAGQMYRFSSYPIDVETADGDYIQFDGGLEAIEIEEQLGFLATSPELQTVAIDVVFPIDVALRVSRGHSLDGATGELSRHVVGALYDLRRRMVVGQLVEPQYGADGEPVSFSLEENPYDDTAVVPSASAIVSEATWPSSSYNVPEASIGLYYPEVFGQPGLYVTEAGASGEGRGSPTIVVHQSGNDAARLVIAAGRVQATTVTIIDEDGVSAVFDVELIIDGLGQAVSTVDISANLTLDRTQELWTCWHSGPAMIGVSGAGSLLRRMLLLSSLRIDLGRLQAVVPSLDRYDVAGYYDTAVSPWEWVQDNLLPLLPLTVAASPDGLAPILWNYDLRSVQTRYTIEEEVNASRVSPVTYDREPRDVVNEIRASYAIDGLDGSLRTLTHGPNAVAGNIAQTTSRHSQVSGRRPRGVVADVLETDIVWTDRTMRLILAWMILSKALPTRVIDYDLGDEAAWLDIGAPVRLVSAPLHIDQAALVVNRNHTDAGVQGFTLLISEDIEDEQ